jgi:hypothetical protein
MRAFELPLTCYKKEGGKKTAGGAYARTMGRLTVGGMTCLDVVHDQLVHLLLNVVRLVAHGDLGQGKERKCLCMYGSAWTYLRPAIT